MSLSIVIPVYNNWLLTKSCLKDLSHLPYDHEIIVVDDGSTDRTKSLEYFLDMDQVNSAHFPREYPLNVKVVKNEKNMGFAYSVNKGYANATNDVILFLNNDIKVVSSFEKWTKIIIEKAKEDLVMGPTVCLLDDTLNYKGDVAKIPEKGLFYLSGWCLAANRNTWEKLKEPGWEGPWETRFKTFFEDGDLSNRMRELEIPFSLITAPLKHKGHETAKKMNIEQMYKSARKKFIEKWTKERIDKMLEKQVKIIK